MEAWRYKARPSSWGLKDAPDGVDVPASADVPPSDRTYPVFMLQIEVKGDAFSPDAAPELARLLREAADKMDRYGVVPKAMSQNEAFWFPERLMDVNGNAVGRMVFWP